MPQNPIDPTNNEIEVSTEMEEQSPALPDKPYQKLYLYIGIGIFAIVAILAVALWFVYRSRPISLVGRSGSVLSQLSSRDQVGVNTNLDSETSYTVVDTNQNHCFGTDSAILCGQSLNGQDAQYLGTPPSYQDNGDGTITDLNTGLMWQKEVGSKQTYANAIAQVSAVDTGGYTDWRVPSIKELYSLMDFSGTDPVSDTADPSILSPFIDNTVFDFEYGDVAKGDRVIDSQWVTSNIYNSTVFNGQECFFGVNFADGRIKCYPTQNNRNNGYFVRYVRLANGYDTNQFAANGNGTVSDQATGLTWQQQDSATAMSWESALAYCQDLNLGGIDDWRLPNAKELQSIVDYSRSPDRTNSPAIDPVFQTTSITNLLNQKDYPYFWTATTHIRSDGNISEAVYVSFGRGMGYMNSQYMDVHGAGSQRSDPKFGNILDYPQTHGPQGDVRRLHNFARCVTGGATPASGDSPTTFSATTSGASNNYNSTNSRLAPSSPPTATGGHPPQAAITACNGKQENASCSFSPPGGSVSGTCRMVGDVLGCVGN